MHNTRGDQQSIKLPSWTICAHCRERGDGIEHLTVSCTCGATGIYCSGHEKIDWSKYAGMTCAEVKASIRA